MGSSVQEVQSKLKVTTVAGGPTQVTRRSQALFTVAGSSRVSCETATSKLVTGEASSTVEVTSGFLLVRADSSVAVPASASPYLPCALEVGVVSQAPPESSGLAGRSVLYVKADAIQYDSLLVVPWGAVLLLL